MSAHADGEGSFCVRISSPSRGRKYLVMQKGIGRWVSYDIRAMTSRKRQLAFFYSPRFEHHIECKIDIEYCPN
jgi:hypothetical protein